MRQRRPVLGVIGSVLLGTLVFSCGGDDDDDSTVGRTVFTGAGDIASTVNEFRAALGGSDNGGTPGQQPSGRRELNWDAVPDEQASPNFLPSNFFNGAASPFARGAVLTSPGGSGVQVSADSSNPSGAAVRFGNINPSYTAAFSTFSPERLFSPIGSNVVDLTFFVAGTQQPATVSGFGAVYTDVDLEESSFEYIDGDGLSLGRFTVPTSPSGLSFLGVVFEEPVVARVRIVYGSSALGPDESASVDVAVMDDFIYGEPRAQ